MKMDNNQDREKGNKETYLLILVGAGFSFLSEYTSNYFLFLFLDTPPSLPSKFRVSPDFSSCGDIPSHAMMSNGDSIRHHSL